MEENSLPPDPRAPVAYDPGALERVTANDNVTVADLSNAPPNAYPIEALEVHNQAAVVHPPVSQPPLQYSSVGMSSVPFSRRRAAMVSLGITALVVIFTGGIMAALVKGRLATKERDNRDVPTQGVTLDSSAGNISPAELDKEQQSLLVSGDIITRGELRISADGFVTTLRSQPLTSNQIINLPATSGTICLDNNNCNFVSQAQLAAVQGQIVEATTINSNSGDIMLQGTTNQVSVTTNGRTVTFTTPQNLHTAASVQFADLQLGGTLRTDTIRAHTAGGNLSVNADMAQILFVDRGRTFSFPAAGAITQTICTSQNNCNYGSGNGDIVNGGQIGPIVIGTDDASTLQFETNNTTRIALQTNGNIAMDTNTLFVDATNNRVGIGTTTPSNKLHVDGGSLLVQGTHTGTSEISVTGSGTRMFFDVGRSAFRAGRAVGDSWEESGGWFGEYSAAFGENTRASQWGFAAGQSNNAGTQAAAFGAGSHATGYQSAAFGQNSRARGQNSFATGVCNVDRSDISHTPTATDALFMIGNGTDAGLGNGTCSTRADAFVLLRNGSTTINGGTLLVQGTHGGGVGNTVTGAGTRMFFDVNKSAFRAGYTNTSYFDDTNVGVYSFASGSNVLAAGNSSVALGRASRANWDDSIAVGMNSFGNGIATKALGYNVTATAYASTALGVCNAASGSSNSWNDTEQLLTVGNGTLTTLGGLTCDTTNNALEMTKNGNLAVDTNTLFVDAVNNRVGVGTAAPDSKLHVVESSTSTTAGNLYGTNVEVTDTGNVASGFDVTAAVRGSATRTGATGGNIISVGGYFSASGDTGGSSVAYGTHGTGYGADTSIGVQGSGRFSGTVDTLIGVSGAADTFLTGGTATNAYGLKGGVLTANDAVTITNAAGLQIDSATKHASGTITNNYGIRVQNQTVGTNDYGLYIEGADTYSLWVDDGTSRLDGNLEVDTDTLFVDAANNRVGMGTLTPSSKLHVVDSSTSVTGGVFSGMNLQVTDTGNVSSGMDGTFGASITTSRTGATGGIITSGGINITSSGDTGGASMVYGVGTMVYGADKAIGVSGTAIFSGTTDQIVGVKGTVTTFLTGGTTTDAYALQGLVDTTGNITNVTNAAGLKIETTQKHASSTLTNNYGIRVENQTAGTNNYGVYVAGADTYAIWVDDGISRFDGNVGINSTTTDNKLNINTLVTADAGAQLAVATNGTTGKGIIVQGVAGQVADLFQAQDSTGAVLVSISATGDLTVETAIINGTLTVNGNTTINGHIISGNTSGSTTVATGAAADCSASGLASISGNDTAGTITITTSTGTCASGILATISFANAHGSAPEVVITPKDANGASLQYYNGGTTSSAFTIDTGVGAAASTVYTYSYHVIE